MKKILFYYHHFGGLGHGTRILSICKALNKCDNNYEIIVINSGKPQPELNINKYAKVINLPYFGARRGLFSGLSSKGDVKSTFEKRKKILDKIAKIFSPDIAIFEHFPLGRGSLEKELVHVIKKMRQNNCKIYSSVRDIIEQKVDVERLEKNLELFAGVLVHSDEDIGFVTSFKKPKILKEKTIFTGRMVPRRKDELIGKNKIRQRLGLGNKKLIVASIGGGIDGHKIINKLIDIKEELDKKLDTLLLITTGLSINPKIYEQFKNKIKNKKDILITKFNPNYLDYVNAADLSISMGGYNSVNNALLTNTKSMIFPRITDKEQKLRAAHLKNFFEVLDYNKISNDELISKIVENINKTKGIKYDKGLNGAEMTARFLVISSSLNDMKIRLTTNCNLNCDMCSWKKKNERLAFPKVKEIINQAKLFGVETINFTGGEPTLYKEFEKLILHAKESGSKISLSTNGVFGKEKLNFIAKHVNLVDISLDSPESYKNDKIRGMNGAFEKTIETIKELSKKGIKSHINVTVRPDNFQGIHKIIPLLSDYIKSVSFTLVDTSINKSEKLRFSKEQLESFYFDEFLLILKETINKKIKLKTSPFFRELDKQQLDNESLLIELLFNKEKYRASLASIFGHSDNACDIAKKQIRINANGELSPCCYLDDYNIQIGNINEKSLLETLISDKYFDFVNNAFEGKGKCSVCKQGYRIYENCFG